MRESQKVKKDDKKNTGKTRNSYKATNPQATKGQGRSNETCGPLQTPVRGATSDHRVLTKMVYLLCTQRQIVTSNTSSMTGVS